MTLIILQLVEILSFSPVYCPLDLILCNEFSRIYLFLLHPKFHAGLPSYDIKGKIILSARTIIDCGGWKSLTKKFDLPKICMNLKELEQYGKFQNYFSNFLNWRGYNKLKWLLKNRNFGNWPPPPYYYVRESRLRSGYLKEDMYREVA